MTRDEAVSRIKSTLADRLLEFEERSEKRLYLEVDRQDISATAELMFNDLEARLQTVSGVDAPGKIEMLYHWALDPLGMLVTIRTHVDRDQPEIASITPIVPAAEWIEREVWELLGVNFTGHPDLRHLVLADDWPEGKHPLRRDYKKDQ